LGQQRPQGTWLLPGEGFRSINPNLTIFIYQVIIPNLWQKVNRMFSGKWGKTVPEDDKNHEMKQKTKIFLKKPLSNP